MRLQKAFESIKKDFCGDCLGCDADFTQTGDHEYYCGIAELARCAKENEAKTVDAAPVVHSGWMASGSGWMCKSCGYQTDESTVYMLLHKYCPDCGAKMDL